MDWPVLDVIEGGRSVHARPTTSHTTWNPPGTITSYWLLHSRMWRKTNEAKNARNVAARRYLIGLLAMNVRTLTEIEWQCSAKVYIAITCIVKIIFRACIGSRIYRRAYIRYRRSFQGFSEPCSCMEQWIESCGKICYSLWLYAELLLGMAINWLNDLKTLTTLRVIFSFSKLNFLHWYKILFCFCFYCSLLSILKNKVDVNESKAVEKNLWIFIMKNTFRNDKTFN